MQRTAYPIWEILLFRSCANSYSYTLAYSQSSIKSYASYSLLKNSSIEISSIGLLEQCSLFFFGTSGMIFLAFFAGTDLRIDFLAVWTKNFQVEGPDTGENLASIVYTVLSELDIGAKLLQLLHRDNANNNPATAEIPWRK
jgi:hypothetical protein